jgi:hypothetical protein
MMLIRRIGWALLILAFFLALTATSLRYVAGGETADIAMIGFAVVMLLGIIALTISAVYRLSRGDVKLRPWLALKSALIIFVTVLVFTFLIWAVFPSMERNLTDVFMHAVIFALGYSLYTTAYRKPA